MSIDRANGVVLSEMVRSADGHFFEAEATLVGAFLDVVGIERHAQHGVLDEGLRGEQGAEGRVVELLHVELGALQREGIDQKEQVRHFVAQTQRIHALEVSLQLRSYRDAA